MSDLQNNLTAPRCQNWKSFSAMAMAQANFCRCVLLYTFSIGTSNFLHLVN